jgi:protein-L-isoaspartate(D-aspartate) O-methyltransferase
MGMRDNAEILLGFGGAERNRTAVRGFAGLCITTLPPHRRSQRAGVLEPGARTVKQDCLKRSFGEARSAVVSAPDASTFFEEADWRDMADFEIARVKMVENQLRANKVLDEGVVDAMRFVPRERFVPAARRGVAYADEDLPLGGGRWLMEPMLFGRLAQLAEVGPDDLALDVGAGMGYGAAVLGQLAGAVVALEPDEALAKAAAEAIVEMAAGGDNIVVETGPLAEGWSSQAPYDVILCEGGIEGRPGALLDQLAEGGRLVAMQRDDQGIQRGVRYLKQDGVIAVQSVFDGATPTLPGFAQAPAFTF